MSELTPIAWAKALTPPAASIALSIADFIFFTHSI